MPRPRPSDAPKPPEEKAEQRDQFDVSIDSINKHIATLNADTAAMFQNNASRAQLRAEFQALTAIMRDEGEVTQEQIDKYEKLRQSMSAQQALEQSGIQLTKEHSDAFLAASRNIKQAADQHDQAAVSLQKLNSASATVGSALETAFADAVVEGKNLNDVLSSLIKTLEKAAINSVFASIFGAPASGGLSPFAGFIKGIIPGFADGTDSAPGGLAWVGENGKELMNVPRGSQIIPNNVASQITSGSTVQNTFYVSGDVSPATIDKLAQSVVAAHRKVDGVTRQMTSIRRENATGVG
ncbi:phage-related tail protein [Bradyrhizobium sp. S3.14.4]